MLTIPTAAANPLNNCQRLNPSMNIFLSPISRGKATAKQPSHGAPCRSTEKLLGARRWHQHAAKKRDFGISRLAGSKIRLHQPRDWAEEEMTASGTSRTSGDVRPESAKWGKADIEATSTNNRV